MAVSAISVSNPPSPTTVSFDRTNAHATGCNTGPAQTTSGSVAFDLSNQNLIQADAENTRNNAESCVGSGPMPPASEGQNTEPTQPIPEKPINKVHDALKDFLDNEVATRPALVTQRLYTDPRAEILLGYGNYSPTTQSISDEQIKAYWSTHTPDESFNAALLNNVDVDRIFEATADQSLINSSADPHLTHDFLKANFRAKAIQFLESKGVDTTTHNVGPSSIGGSYADLRTEILFTTHDSHGSSSLSRDEIRKIASDPTLTTDQKFDIAVGTGTSVYDIAGALHDFGQSADEYHKLLGDLTAQARAFAKAHGFNLHLVADYKPIETAVPR